MEVVVKDIVEDAKQINGVLFIDGSKVCERQVRDIKRALPDVPVIVTNGDIGVTGVNISYLVNRLTEVCHMANKKWWFDINTGKPLERNKGELIALIHSELSEALEAERKNLMDDKLPNRKGLEVELADALIRIFDMAGGLGLDLGGALSEKLEYNANRSDHKVEERRKEGGKKF